MLRIFITRDAYATARRAPPGAGTDREASDGGKNDEAEDLDD